MHSDTHERAATSPPSVPSFRCFVNPKAFAPRPDQRPTQKTDTGHERVHEVSVCAKPFLFAEFGTMPWPFTLSMYCEATVESM